MKKWIIRECNYFDSQLHKNKLVNSLLSSRGLQNESEVEDFLHPVLSKLYNPFILKDMDEAIDRIDKAIEKRQKIVIYGDYDVDGITSTAILFRAFKKLGVEVNYYIPDRMVEGYGINKDAIDYIKTLQTDLIITVDCGITSVAEVEYAKQLGMDIIITDHHECKDKIPNTIVINPKRPDCVYPNKALAGCGVAFKIVQALWIKYNLYGFDDFLDIAAIGTIADVVELKGENRIIVKIGLSKINTSVKNGIRALKEVTNIGDNINSFNVAFQLAPRINAVGRLSDAKIAVELFVTNDYDKALQIAKFLDQENKKRQKIEEKILHEALKKIEEQVDLKNDKVIILNSSKWHHGVVGIVASKLVEQYSRPVILLCQEGGISKGSGRSIKGYSLFDALCSCSDVMEKFGGHDMAAGLTIKTENIGMLMKKLNEFGENLDKDIYLDKLYAEVGVDTDVITMHTAELLKALEPYGNGNPSPVLYMEDLHVVDMKGIGTNEQHLKLQFTKNNTGYDGIFFNASKNFIEKPLEKVDIMFNLDINEWKNTKNIQLVLKGMRPNPNYLRETLDTGYYKNVKFMLKDETSPYNMEKINFIDKNMEFLKEFIYFGKGYILVSSHKALKELEDFVELVDVNTGSNFGLGTQMIVCPIVESIDIQKNDVLIYDFLPGCHEYKVLAEKTEGTIYNFLSSATDIYLDSFIQDIELDQKFVNELMTDLQSAELVGSIKELSDKYCRNNYLIYNMIMKLKEKAYVDIMIKNDTLKIKLKTSNISYENVVEGDSMKIRKLVDLKTKFEEFLKGE